MIKILIIILVLGPSCQSDGYPLPHEFRTGYMKSSFCINMTPVCHKTAYDSKIGVCNCYIRGESKDLCCDFKDKNATLTSKDVEEYTSLRIANARAFSYVCHGNLQKTLKLYNVETSSIDNKISGKEETCNLNYVIKNSSSQNLVSAQSIKLDKSVIFEVRNSQLLSLEMTNSNIEELSSSNIVGNNVNEENYCAELHHSAIESIKNINIYCALFIDNLSVSDTVNLTLVQSKIESATFINISSYGLSLIEQKHLLHDVMFEKLKKNALVIDSDFHVNFASVEIQSCEEPCILVLNGGIVSTDLVIEHNLVDTSKPSKYISVINETLRTFIDSKLCKIAESKDGLVCDLASYKAMRLEYRFPETIESVKLMNHHSVAIYIGCKFSLLLHRLTGYLNNERHSTEECLADSSLFMKLTSLHHAKLNKLAVLKVSNSNIHYLYINEVRHLDMEKSYLNSIVDVTHKVSTSHKVGTSHFKINSTEIESIYNLTLLNKAYMEGITINGSIYKLTIDHSWSDETVIKNANIQKIHSRGIILNEGTLVLDNVFIHTIMHYGIILGNDAFLRFEKNIRPVYCLHGAGIIAPMRSRVILKDMKTAQWLRECVYVISKGNSHEIGRHNMVFQDCHVDEYKVADCNMRQHSKPVAIGFNNEMDDVRIMNISDAVELQIGNHCFDEIRIQSVPAVKYYEKEYCYHTLYAENSTIDEVGVRMIDLELKYSKAHSIKSNFVNAYITKSQIGTFEASVENIAIMKSHLLNLKKMDILFNGTIENAEIGLIGKNSIFVDELGTLSFVNIVINKMETGAINVKGNLFMRNVTIKQSKPFAFIRKKLSEVSLIDVNFEKSVQSVFGIEKRNRRLYLLNVKLNGEKYTKNDIFRNDETEHISKKGHMTDDGWSEFATKGFLDPVEEEVESANSMSPVIAGVFSFFSLFSVIALCCGGFCIFKYYKRTDNVPTARVDGEQNIPLHDVPGGAQVEERAIN